MAYKKDDNGGQAAASAAPSGGSSGSGGGSKVSAGGSYSKGSASGSRSYASSKASAKASTRISGAGSRDSSAHAAASADRAAAAGRGKVASFTPSVRGGSSGSSGGRGLSPAWVGKNPYQWGNTSTIVNHWDDRDPERQAKLNALGFAADDPDRTFHFYEPDKGSPKSYLDQANALSSDRNYYQAGNFWNTINGQYASEEDRVSDAMEWMKDAQIYGKWAKDHDLTYTDESGEERSMEEAWKEIWSYANDIAGGIGDSDSTRAQKNIQTYLTGGEYSSEQTKQLLEQARQFSENAESEKDAKLWADLEKSLNIQLKDDEKREKREGSFLGKAGNLWDTFTGLFERPEREEQGELTDTQRAYQQAAAEDQMYSGFATDPLSAAAFAPVAEKRDELAEQVKAENREAGREVYAGMADEDRLGDMTESWLGGRGAGTMAGVAGGLYAADSMFYDNDEIRELTQRKFIADQNLLTTGDQKYREESEALQAQIDEAQQRANENGENGTPLGDAAGMLLDSARGMQATADQQWQDATEDMSEGEKFLANVGKTGADVAADIVENAIAPGVGTMRMYLGAGGSGAMEQAGRENNDPDSIATATITRAASAWLSTKLVGGMESAYGQSILGGITEQAFANASPAVQAAAKTLLNTEGVEEGLEDILNYAGDLILGLNEEAQLNWDEVKQDALVGYVLGVLTNGLSAGINYNSKARHALAEEAVEFAQSGLSIEEAAEIGKESTKEDIVMKPQPESADLQAAARAGTNAAWNEQAASQNAAIEGQNQTVTPAPENVNLQDTAVSSQDTAPQAAPASSGPTANATPYEGPQLPGGQYGGGGSVKIGKDRVPFHYAVIPASELIPSHGVDGTPNPNYPAELQPRDRTRETSQAQVRDIGAALNPEELEWSGTASTGAPVVRSDGVVISGNGRTSGIAYSQQIGRNAEYMQYIRDNAPRFGIDPATIQDGSVLVRVVDGEDHDWAKLAAGGNDSGVAKYSASESATADAKRLTSDGVSGILDLLNPEADGVTDSRNDAFVRAFIRDVVPESEWGSMYTTKKNDQGVDVTVPSSDAYRRARNALFQAAYGDTALLARVSEGDDGSRVVNALVGIAPKLLNVENGAANGSLGNYGLRDHILSAFNLFQDARAAGQSVAEMTANMSMFSEADADTIYLARFFEEQRNATNRMSWFLNGMCDRIMQHGAPESADSFGGFGLFEEGAEDTFGFGDVIEGGRENYAAEGKQPLPERDVWGRGSYEELADVAGLNQKERGEYYRDPDRARTSPTDSGYAGGSEPVAAGETDAGSSGRDGQQGADTGSGAGARVSELAKRMLAGEVSDEEYLSLIDSEEGRVQLAEALGIQDTDKKSVAAGLSIYLLYQDQIRQSINQTTQTDETVVDNLLGEEPEAAPESATEPATETQENPEEVNSQPEETNASDNVLNAQETGESGNPFFETEETAEPEQRKPPKERVSEVSTNTLKREEGANYRGDLTYTPHPQAQLILDAYARLGEDPSGMIRDLTKPGMWTDAQVKAGKIVRDTLYQEAASTGDYSAYDAWRKITQEHSTPVAQSLAAMRADPELTAERLYDNSNKFLDEIEAGEVAGVRGVDAKVVAEARKNVSDISGKIARLELEQKSAAKSGKTNKQAWEQVKERYLDLADEINSIRHVGLIVDARKNKAIRKGQQDIDTSLHDMLGKESEDYIKRYVNLAAAGIANDVKYRGKISADKVAKYVNGLQKLCQLGTTGTTLRNLEGNASFGVFNWASDNTGGVVMDQLLSLFTGQRSLGLQAGVFGKRERAAAKTAARRSVLEIAANIDLLDNGSGSKYGVTGNLTVNPYSTNPINRFYARAQQTLSYALNTSDAFFYGMQQESAANAAKRANKNLTDEQAQAIGRQSADYATFKNDTFISKILEEFQAAADVIGWGGEVTRLGIVPVQRKGGFGLGTLMAPYIKVPVNIGLKAAEFRPIGGAVGAVHAAQAVSAAKSGNADAILMQNRAAAEMGRGVFGTGVLLALAALMKEADWFKNWNDEDDPDVKAQNKAEGKYGLQINLDMFRNALLGKPHGDWSSGKKVNIDSIEPLNAILAEASMIADWTQGITVNAIKNAVITGTLDGVRDLPAISSITTIADTMTYNTVYVEDEEGNRVEDKGATVENALAAGLGNSLSGFVPGALRHAARIADEYDRDTSGDTAVEQAVNQFKAAVPGLRETLPVKTDNFGNPVSTGSVGTRIANNLLANKYNDVEQGELSKEIERLRTETGVSVMPSKNGPSTVKFGDETARLSREQRREWKNDYGQGFADTVDLLMRSSIYRDADDELKVALMKEVGSYVKDGVKADFGEENGYEVKKEYAYLDDVDNPVTFLTANKAFNLAEKKDDWDVVDTLIGPVGKLSQDEQELMRDKNSTLMSYYDYLTPNDRGYKVKDAATVRAYKAGTKANAGARGKDSPSGQDKFNAIMNGYRDKTFTDEDIDAIMSKAKTKTDEETGEEKVTWDVTKARAALYLAMRAGGATVWDALEAVNGADVDGDGTVDENGVKIKAEYEATNALKRANIPDRQAAQWEFDEIEYPWKHK